MKLKKIMILSVALLTFNLTVTAGDKPEGKNAPAKLEATCWTAAGPGESCWKMGTNKKTVDPTNDDCYTVECPAPFDPCCIWMSGGKAVIVVNEEIITFSSFDIINPGDDLGQGASIIGYLN